MQQPYSRSLAIIAAISALFARQGQTAQTIALAQSMSSGYVSRGKGKGRGFKKSHFSYTQARKGRTSVYRPHDGGGMYAVARRAF